MSDTNNSEPCAASGSGKSPEEIAFELVSKLKGQGVWGERNQSAILDMYAECLDAVKGLRSYEGQNRIMAPIRQASSALVQTTPQNQVQNQVQGQPQIQSQPQAPVPSQPQTVAAPIPAAPSTVQAQQFQVQQAFKQG